MQKLICFVISVLSPFSERSKEEEKLPSQITLQQGEEEEPEEAADEEEEEGSKLGDAWTPIPVPSPQPPTDPIIPNSVVHPGPPEQGKKRDIYVYREWVAALCMPYNVVDNRGKGKKINDISLQLASLR